MSFSSEQIDDLKRGLAELPEKYVDLRQLYFDHAFRTEGAKEHASHGFSRRVGTLARCVERVFELLPPDRVDIPERDETVDATINIQAFVLNAFGCCENLAWIWVFEKGVLQPNGRELTPRMVGMGESYRLVRNSFTQEFRDYLDTRREWFRQLTNFRDALAHRIPLYIPPYMVDTDHADAYRALGVASWEALRNRDLDGHHRLEAEQMALAKFQPYMTHSLSEESHLVVFHAQLLADFNTIDEIARRLLDELARG